MQGAGFLRLKQTWQKRTSREFCVDSTFGALSERSAEVPLQTPTRGTEFSYLVRKRVMNTFSRITTFHISLKMI